MARRLAAILLLGGAAAYAQTTSTTATVVDTDGTAWINAPYTVSVVSAIPPVTAPGNNVFQYKFTGTTDGTGTLGPLTLQRVTNIYPSATWRFCVSPNVSIYVTYCVNVPVGNAGQSSQDVSAQINAVIKAPRVSPGAMALAYADTELPSVGGTMYYNVSQNLFRCYTTSWSNCGGTGTGIGNITWVVPSFLSASPATLNASGTQSFNLTNQTANTIFAGPASGSAAAPTFRTLVANDMPYLQGATGSVSRTVASKLQEGVSVVDFGADPTGTADSTAAIAAAIEWAGTNPSPTGMTGGTINFPCGRYRVNPTVSFLPYSGTVFQGCGKNGTFIQYTGSSTNPVWDVNSFNNGTRGLNISWRDLTMLGNNTTAGSVCFHFGVTSTATGKVQNIVFDHVKITQCGHGVQLDDVWNFTTFDTQIIFNLGDGIRITDPDALTGAYLYGTRVGNNGGRGINNVGAGVVTQFEQNGGEDTYNALGDVVTGIARDWEFDGVWFEHLDAPSAQNALDVTGAQGLLVNNGHFNFTQNAIFASAPVSYITIRNSALSNGQTNFVNVPTGSTIINYSENNRSNVPSTVGSATAQFTVGCPGSSDLALTTGTGLAVNGCTGNNIQTWGANAALEAVLSNVGNLSLKGGLLSLSGSIFGQLATGSSSAGMTITRNVADAFAPLTINNANAGSTADILDIQSQGTNQDGYTFGGIPYNRIGSAIASATTIAPTAPSFHLSGTTPVSTITPPLGCTISSASGCRLRIITDAAAPFVTGGNIAAAVTGVAGQAIDLTYDVSQSLWYPSGAGSSGGGGLTNPMTSPGDMIYGGAAGAPQRLAGPTTGSVAYNLIEIPGSAPTFALAGIAGRTVSTTTDTIVATDRGTSVTYASASAVAVTLTSAASLGANFDFVTSDQGAGAVTFTPGAGTINGGSTLVMNQGDTCAINSADGTNYVARCGPGQLIAGTNVSFTRSAAGITINATGGGGGVNAGTTNQVAYYASSGSTVSGITTLPTSAMPGLTGDVTNSAGSLATTVGKVNGVTYPATPSTHTTPVITASNTASYVTTNRALGWAFGDVVTGSALTTSEVGYITVPFACTLTGWHIMADSGTVTIKMARVNGGTALPTSSNFINTAGIALASGTKIDSTTLSDFTSTAIAQNDTLGFFITAVSGPKQVTVQLDCAQ